MAQMWLSSQPISMQSVEQRARNAITTAFKRHFAIPKDKLWVCDFLCESILVELANQSSAASNSSPSLSVAEHNATAVHAPASSTTDGLNSLLPCDLPETTASAETLWGPLLYDNLDALDPEDVTAFCEQVLAALNGLAAEYADEGAEGGSDSGSEEGEEGACEMCGRIMKLTKHHLIPRQVHKEWKRKGATFDQLQSGAMICRSCHSAVHRVADNKTLARQYDTVQKLMQVESIQRHVAWASKQKVIVRAPGSTARTRHRR